MHFLFSVSIIIYNTTRKVLIFVKQFRPGMLKKHAVGGYILLAVNIGFTAPALIYFHTAVYLASIPEYDQQMKIATSKYPPECGITLELCAGIVDKDLPLEEVARIEVLEECGYDIPVSNLERIISYR
jgi:UDP-sugar diphosphatase